MSHLGGIGIVFGWLPSGGFVVTLTGQDRSMLSDPVALLAGHIEHMLGPGPFPPPPGWSHMGAVICDAMMQGGLRYTSTVLPRVKRLQELWPEADVVSRFRVRIATGDLPITIKLSNQRKIAAIGALAECLSSAEVESTSDLRTWLCEPDNRDALLAVKGVGPKTVAYLSTLVGRPSVAVDVHLRRFAAAAGVRVHDAAQLEAMFEQVADHFGHDRSGLDHAVWRLMSGAAPICPSA
jgi:hypothetical protein